MLAHHGNRTRQWLTGWAGGETFMQNSNIKLAFTHVKWHLNSHNQLFFFHHLIHLDTHSVFTSDAQSWALVLLTSSCQFSLNHTIWSTMPSRDDSRVGCSSRCICIILLQRHIGAVARIGPGSEAPECCWAPTELGCCCPDASGEINLWRE